MNQVACHWIEEWKREIAQRLDAQLREIRGISVQDEQPYARHIYHLYTFFYDPLEVGASKDDFIRYLEQEEGIQLPIFDHLSDDQIEHMSGGVRRAVEHLGT